MVEDADEKKADTSDGILREPGDASHEHDGSALPATSSMRTIFGYNPFKVLFAMEYVLQGIANPFQGITYQPFFNHFRYDYGLSEAATQQLFSRSYLAWSFKPVLGFFMDAFGKTKVVMAFLLSTAVLFFLLTPLVDTSALIFFWMTFALAVVLAATDVAVDRATVIQGEEESKTSGKSKSTTVGLNQAICWGAIYGTSIVAAVSGGYIADNIDIDYLMYLLALVPLAVLIVVFFLPRDTSIPIPLKNSVVNFWEGLHTGPVMWIILFYFLFHFQPAMGALWTNYQIEELHFTQTQIGFADGASYIGLFIGVIIFATAGIRWQDRLGLKRLFKIFILLSIAVNLTQYMLIEPWFGQITEYIHRLVPFASLDQVRFVYLSTYNMVLAVFLGIIRMSTFSLVGAVIPVSAAGSLFAGFMSVSNLAYSFSYSSGAWLYDNGLSYGVFRYLQQYLFGIQALEGERMSIALLVMIGSMAYLLSFLAAHMLPDRRQTLASEDEDDLTGPQRYRDLGDRFMKTLNTSVVAVGLVFFFLCMFVWKLDIIETALLIFFGLTFARKLFLDRAVRKMNERGVQPLSTTRMD